ncbi:MAG: M56 family metallopeptidase [bacterium]|nr:M56 family metallopeptidase [bacterium]MCM1374892.1 M56 family metallopeptidase [Muribaculum sp.]
MSNILLVVITMCFRSDSLLMNIGYKLMAVFCLVTLLRLLLPFELPITKTLPFPEAITYVIGNFRHSYGTVLGIDISLWTGFCAVWIVGIILQVVLYIREYLLVKNYVRIYGVDITKDEPYASMLKELCTEKQLRHVRIMLLQEIEAPMVFGLWRSKILLPAGANVSDSNARYAIEHEIYHYIHHDLWIKVAVSLLVTVYWWNPCSHVLKRQIDMLIEMRIDDHIMGKGPEEALAYVSSIHRYAVSAKDKQKDKQETAPLFGAGDSAMHYRMCVMKGRYNRANYIICFVMLLLMLALYAGSYLFIGEASGYYKLEESDALVTITEENVSAIQNQDGTYDIYLEGGIYLETTDSLEYYPEDMKIYSSEEEYLEQNPQGGF